jgi:ATP/maltotriose-dependent transcriptional regulator MalT
MADRLSEAMASTAAEQRIKIEAAKALLRMAQIMPEKISYQEAGLKALEELEDVTTVAIVLKEIPTYVTVSGYRPLTPERIGLTTRETDVLVWMADGKSNREIAKAMSIPVDTVKSVTERLYGKLGVRNRAGAVAKALSLQIIEHRATEVGEPDV